MIKMYKWLLAVIISVIAFSCSRHDFETNGNANDFFHIRNGDYNIPLIVRGNTKTKKIILFIQGGPGLNTLDFAKIDFGGWKKTLENDYAIAYYDQRGMGNAQGNFSLGNSALNTWVEDLHTIASFLKKAYDSEIILMGHSFGGVLMYKYMIEKGSNGAASKYISLNAPVSTDAETDTLRWKFRRTFLYNTAILEISRGKRVQRWNEVLQWLSATPEIKKLPGENPYRLMDQWNIYVEDLVYTDYPEKKPDFKDYIDVLLFSPYNPLPAYLKGTFKGDIADRIQEELRVENLMSSMSQINNQRLLMITGRYDDVCVPEELDFVFNKITSSQKEKYIIDSAGHSPFDNQPEIFYSVIRSFVQ